VSLAEAFATPPEPVIKGPRCGVGRLLVTLPDEDAQVLRAVLANQSWSPKRIAERLRKADLVVSRASVQRHRNGDCLCGQLGVA
jgi:ribosomal protein RSM22 (predicted rRNA methylase)